MFSRFGEAQEEFPLAVTGERDGEDGVFRDGERRSWNGRQGTYRKLQGRGQATTCAPPPAFGAAFGMAFLPAFAAQRVQQWIVVQPGTIALPHISISFDILGFLLISMHSLIVFDNVFRIGSVF